jgi:hypothetical protein
MLFVLFNVVHIAAWEWDQIKIFISLYCVLLALWSYSKERVLAYAQVLLVILCIPALVETYLIFNKGELYSVYSEEDIALAQVIRATVPEGSSIAAAPKHNSAVTLTGRSMYMGYAGTLWSHQIEYADREQLLKSLPDLAVCRTSVPEKQRKHCPDFLLWDAHASQFWGVAAPSVSGIEPLGRGSLYKLH